MIGGLLAHGVQGGWNKLYTAPEGKVAMCTINCTSSSTGNPDSSSVFYEGRLDTAISNHAEGPSKDPYSVLGRIESGRTWLTTDSATSMGVYYNYGHPAIQRTGVIVPGGYSVWVKGGTTNIYGFVTDLPKNTNTVKVSDVAPSSGLTKTIYTCPESKIATVNVYLASLSGSPVITLEARDSDQADETPSQRILGPTYFGPITFNGSHISEIKQDRRPGSELTGLVLRSGQKLCIKNTGSGSLAISIIGFETAFAD